MSRLSEKLQNKKAEDLRVLSDLIFIFCREKHRAEAKNVFHIKDDGLRHALDGKHPVLCHDCSKLLNHAIVKLLLCPYDPKPACRKCQTHCYAPVYREKIREVMRFSGLYLIRHGRLHLIARYLF